MIIIIIILFLIATIIYIYIYFILTPYLDHYLRLNIYFFTVALTCYDFRNTFILYLVF